MNRKTFLQVVLVVSAMSCVATVNAGDAAAGQTKAASCAGCHGAKGMSNSPLFPNLAGQKEQYLVNAIKKYMSGERNDASMKALLSSLSDADVENLAAFYASQSCN